MIHPGKSGQAHRSLVAPGVVALTLLMAQRASAQPVPVTLDSASICWCRTTLAGRASPWTAAIFQGSLDIGSPPSGGVGQVVIRNLRLTIPSLSSLIVIPPTSQVSPQASNLVLSVAPFADLTLQGLAGAPGQTVFDAPAAPCGLAGVIDYAASPFACATLQSGGAPCSGTFNLAAPGLFVAGAIASGVIDRSDSPGTVSLTVNASAPMMPGASWGNVEIWAVLHGTLGAASGQNPCPADFNGGGGVTVRDIFDFLAAWFTSDPRANFNHDAAINVRDIFDFLAAWFAGC